MKKIIVILAVILVVAAGVIFAGTRFSPSTDKPDETTTVNLSDLFFVQYCVYAPETARVSLDGKALTYNENIDCFSTEVKKEGSYRLLIEQAGCEKIDETVYISAESREYTPDFSYSSSFISDAGEAGKKLLEEIMQKCWSLSFDLSDFDFTDDEAQLSCEEKAADIVSALEEASSAGYTVGELKLNLTPDDKTPSNAPDSEGSSVLLSFEAEYSFDWSFDSEAYKDKGTAEEKTKPYIIIESRDGKWLIRDFYISLDNKIM